MTTDTVGGVWTFTKDLASELLQQGWEIVLVSFGGAPSVEQQAAVDQLSSQGLEYLAIDAPLEWMPENSTAYTTAEPFLLELCARFQPDALLLGQFCFGALPVKQPKIAVAHSDVLGWSDAVGKAPLAEDKWLCTYRQLVQTGLNGADLVVAPTAAMLASMAPHYNLPGRLTVIPNGRSLEPHTPFQPRKLRAVIAGRMWDPAKNLALLLDVRSPMPILVAGEPGSEATSTGELQMLGKLDEGDLMSLFQDSAVYICCSQYEPFGLAPLEAALCGCAVLAYDIASLREVWGEGALYFRNASELTLLLQRLVADPERLLSAQQASFTRAQKYSAAAMADAYRDLIASCVANRTLEAARAA